MHVSNRVFLDFNFMLLAVQDTEAALRKRLCQLQQMAARNAKDKVIHTKVIRHRAWHI